MSSFELRAVAGSAWRKAGHTGSVEIRRFLRILLDLSVSAFSFLLAILLSIGPQAFVDARVVWLDTTLFLAVCSAIYTITGLSFRSWRFVSLNDMFTMARDIAGAILIFTIFTSATDWPRSWPLSISLITYFAMVTMLGGMRVLYRSLNEGSAPFGLGDLLRPQLLQKDAVNILAYGARGETDALVRALQSENAHAFRIVGIIDDDPLSRDRHIRGVRVLGATRDLPRIVENFKSSSIEVAKLALPASSLGRRETRNIVDAAAAVGLRTVRIPPAVDLLLKDGDALEFEPIKVTDLLGREPVALQLDSIDALIRGKRIVVTGGGGSIGKELCRQLLRRAPSKLIIIDHSELNLFEIERELSLVDENSVITPILASIREKDKITSIFAWAEVELVFHAAAYKHVPLVEANPVEGILTNFIGTANVAEAAAAAGAAAMIMISTDKAVKPQNTMGLSKRIAETYCQAMDFHCAASKQPTRFMVVRFGNVLGSSGSVVPTFDAQIRRGGPVTVTDPNMTRYFMTIPEAVSLVLQGSAFGLDHTASTGAIMVLDMGEPVKILDLATRMISLAGFVPGEDIPIKFVGVRDGEKLHEELFDEDETPESTLIPGIRIARSRIHDMWRMRDLRDAIAAAGLTARPDRLIAMVRQELASASQEDDRARVSQIHPRDAGQQKPNLALHETIIATSEPKASINLATRKRDPTPKRSRAPLPAAVPDLRTAGERAERS